MINYLHCEHFNKYDYYYFDGLKKTFLEDIIVTNVEKKNTEKLYAHQKDIAQVVINKIGEYPV